MATALTLVVLAATGSTTAGGEDPWPGVTVVRWTFSNGPEFPGATGRLRREPTANADGELQFDFSAGGNYVAAYCDGPQVDAAAVRISVDNPAGNRLTFRYTDSAGTTFQKSCDQPTRAWQRYEIMLTGDATRWGGPGDGVFRPPVRQFGLLVENSGQATKGTIRFRDLTVVHGEATLDTVQADLSVTDFRDGFGVHSGTGSRFEHGRWAYAMGPQERRAGLRCASLSLPGEPQTLRLQVDSDGSGHSLAVQLASHFQWFEREVGVLDATGAVTFEVPLGNMNGWRYSGGENDGAVRYPLRLMGLVLHARQVGAQGSIALRGLSVSSRSHRSRAILLAPRTVRRDTGLETVEIAATSLFPQVQRGTLNVTLYDSQGQVVLHKGGAVQLAPGFSTLPGVDFRLGERLYLDVRCTLVLDSGDRYTGNTSACALPAPVTVDRSVCSPFGMGLYLYRYPATEEGYADMEAAAALGARAGVVWSREEFNWSMIEPERGDYRWAYFDRMVETAAHHGIQIYGIISYWSPWTQPNTPQGIADYCAYARALVSRYGNRIKHWEIWNEPNIFFWTGPREMYGELLLQAGRAIKETDPEAQVLGCSTAGIDGAFVRDIVDRGIPFDILTIHPYRAVLAPDLLLRELREIRRLVQRPVWITEMGWPTEVGGTSERRQAALVSQVYVTTLASGAVENVSWYDFRNDGTDPFYNEENFGVVRRDLTPKPGYLALTNALRHLEGFYAQPLGEIRGLPQGIYGCGFEHGGRRLLVLWPGEDPALLVLNLDGTLETATDFTGGAISLAAVGKRRLLPLLPGEPVFLTGTGLRIRRAVRGLTWTAEPPQPQAGETLRLHFALHGRLRGATVDLVGHTLRDNAVHLSVPAGHEGQVIQLTVRVHGRGWSASLPVSLPVGRRIVRL